MINLKKGSIVTSGHNKQYFESGSHIVGSEDEILTTTLVSNKSNCYELDAFGTYLSQLNGHDVLDLIEFDDMIKDIECLANSYVHAQKIVGSDKIPVPNKFATEKDWDAVYEKLGRPKDATGYKYDLGEDAKINEDALKNF